MACPAEPSDIKNLAAPGAGVSTELPTWPSLSQEHLEFRRLVAELEKYKEPWGCEGDEKAIEAIEAAMGRLNEEISALERKIWATPARTLADVLLRGEIALWNENGVMDFIDDADAYEDDRATAQLIRAVVSVLGEI